MKHSIVEDVLRRLHVLEKERRSWESHWQEIAELMLPSKGIFSGSHNSQREKSGEKRHHKIVDSTAIYALRILAAGMHGGLSSPARPWFRLALKDRSLENAEGVGEWLQDTQEKVHAILAGSNFYPTVHAHYAELAAFGTGVFLIEEDPDEVIRCRNLTVGEYYLDCDSRGRVNTLYRRFFLNAMQAYERFPDTCPKRICELAKAKKDASFEIIHAIEPRENYDISKEDPKNRPFASYYVMVGHEKTLLEEGGYEDFPACCPRWDVTGSSVYGRGPGMDALPDVAMLQRMRSDGLDALELEIKPPMNVSNSIRNQGGQFSLRPGFANFVDTNSPAPAITPTYQVKSNLQALDSYLQQIRTQIGEHFYKDLFLLLSQTDKRMTATEVNERNAEKLIMLGPTLERLRSELFQPLIQRVFGIMKYYAHLKPVPLILQGKPWEIEMQSTLALAQKSSDISAIQEVSTYAGALATANPDILDNLDTDEMLIYSAKLMGVPTSILRGKERVLQMRAQRKQETQSITEEAKQLQLVENGVELATKLSDIDLSKDTVATRMVHGISNLVTETVPQLMGSPENSALITTDVPNVIKGDPHSHMQGHMQDEIVNKQDQERDDNTQSTQHTDIPQEISLEGGENLNNAQEILHSIPPEETLLTTGMPIKS